MNHPKNNQPLARARRDELVVQEMPDEVLVYDLKNHKAHCLNQTAAFVWKHCDGQTTVSEMAALMSDEWAKPVTEEVVWLALKQLSRSELLEERVADPDSVRASRRAVLRKLGAAAAMTPLVISIVAPTASAGSSVPPVCLACTVFGSGANRSNTCPPDCGPTIFGCCFNNSSCSTGAGGLLCDPCNCQTCFTANPTSSGWRAHGGGFSNCA